MVTLHEAQALLKAAQSGKLSWSPMLWAKDNKP